MFSIKNHSPWNSPGLCKLLSREVLTGQSCPNVWVFFFPILLPLESISFLKEEEQNNNSSHFLHATWCRTTEGPLSVVTHLIFVPTL